MRRRVMGSRAMGSRAMRRTETRESVIAYEKAMRDLERAQTEQQHQQANDRVIELERNVSWCRRHDF